MKKVVNEYVFDYPMIKRFYQVNLQTRFYLVLLLLVLFSAVSSFLDNDFSFGINQLRLCIFFHKIQHMLHHTVRVAAFVGDTGKADGQQFMVILIVHFRNGNIEFVPCLFHKAFEHHQLFLQAGDPVCPKSHFTGTNDHFHHPL